MRKVHLRYHPVVTIGQTRTACGRTIYGQLLESGAVQSFSDLDATVNDVLVTCKRCLDRTRS